MPRVEERTELKCRSCGEIVPTNQYSYSQKKKKHRRRCPPCVACALYLRGDGPKPAGLSAVDESKMSEEYGQIQLTEQLLPPQNLSGVSHLKTIVVEPTHAPAPVPSQRRARTEAHKKATASSIPATYQNSSSVSSAPKSKKKSAQKQKAAQRKSRAAAAEEASVSPASSQKSAVSPVSPQKSAQEQESAQRKTRIAATTTAEAVSPAASTKSSSSSSSSKAKALSPTAPSSSSSSQHESSAPQQKGKNSAPQKSRDERDVAEELLADDDEAVFKKPKTKKEQQEALQFHQFEEAEAGFVGGKQLDVQEADAESFVKLKKTPKPEHRRTPSSSDQARALYMRQLSGRKKIRAISRDFNAEPVEEPELMKGGKGRKRLGPLEGGYPRESMKPGPERVIGE